tara:strand:- start:42 stop:824 length:783 start_codon:yes stop_codon:yes gene_type:complete
MSSYVEYRDATDTTASPSPIIWADCPVREFIEKGNGVHYFEDFVAGGAASATAGSFGVFLDASATFTYADEVNGAGVLTEDGTANEGNSLFGAPAFKVSRDSGTLWFEARVKFDTAAADKQGWFVGLMDATATSEVIPLTAASALSDHNMVGFHKPEENSAAFDTSYKANGVTAVEVNSNVGALVADTYVKLGMKFDPKDNLLRFYINGEEQASTKEIPSAAGTDFPNDVAMKFVVAHLLEAAEARTVTVDWIKVAQRKG